MPTSALHRGTKTPLCWGVLACGTTSDRPLWGYLKRATLGGCTAELKSSAAWGSSMQQRPAVQMGVVLADRVLGVAPWGPSFRRGPLHANSHAGRLGTTFRGVVGVLSCTDTTAYPAGQKKKIKRSYVKIDWKPKLFFNTDRPTLRVIGALGGGWILVLHA